MFGDAVSARQLDLWAARAKRESELLDQYMALTRTVCRNGMPTKEEKRLSYALYDVDRHHNEMYK
jgi:hypothetical protein